MMASTSALPGLRAMPERAEARRRLSDIVERAIALLDALDGDPESEPSLGAPEFYPVLGCSWQAGPRSDGSSAQLGWANGGTDDREVDQADEPEQAGVLLMLGHAEPERRRVRPARSNRGGAHVAA